MTAKYTVVAKGNPQDPLAPKKYYAAVKSTGRAAVRDMADQVARISTVSSIDLVAMIEAFLVTIPEELADGKIVDLGDFGSFRLRIHSDGSDTEEEVSARNITRVTAGFYPGKRFKEVLSHITFEK